MDAQHSMLIEHFVKLILGYVMIDNGSICYY